MNEVVTARWKRLDQPGTDTARLLHARDQWILEGEAAFEHEGAACRLSYLIVCRRDWITERAEIRGTAGKKAVSLEISADAARRWTMNGRPVPATDGCVDLDLSFTPATNVIAIRRLGLALDQRAQVRSAWLLFPDLDLKPLAQTYRRLSPTTYDYRSEAYAAPLVADDYGFVMDYPGLWARRQSA